MIKTSNSRYFVDVRVGCIAIIDSFYPYESNGLNCDQPNIVQFRSFDSDMSESSINMYKEQMEVDCYRLNLENTLTVNEVCTAIQQFNTLANKLKSMFPNAYCFDHHNLRDFYN